MATSTATPREITRVQPTRRNTELGLMVLAFIIGGYAMFNTALASGEGIDNELWIALAVLAGVGLVGHLAVRFLAPYAEPIMLPTAYLLNFLGLVMIYRLDIAEAQRAQENASPEPTPAVLGQLTWTIVGILLVALVFLIVRDHRKLQRYTYISLFIGVVLLLLPLAPGIGETINGATLWIRIGSLTFQPAELAKIALTIFLAGYLVTKRESLKVVKNKFLGVPLPRGRDLGPLLAGWLLAMAIIAFESEIGTAVIFFGLFITLLYVATQRRGWVLLGLIFAATGAVFAYLAFSHVRVRFEIWLDPFADAEGTGFQVVQSLFGLANGGLLGTGWAQGYPQLVPFANSDFILASFGEELGLTGLIAILLLFGILVQRGLRTAVACRDVFGRLLATGLATVFGLQVFVVAAGVTKLIPMTGLTTPFMSAGGSALIANWIMIGILLRISDVTRRPDPVVTSPDDALTQVVRL
ncbi:MAG: FtsW/RodA/SpoVE family cell cycle protein [Actinomycetia bacterium]|nr:FtsW/RodA/SpoVE family cell cycle protein [Actinomycetes bacterium]